MIKSINGLILRFFKFNKFIVLSSIISIAISIFLVVTLFAFQFTAKQKLLDDTKMIYGEMDLSTGYDDIQKRIDSNLYQQITSLDGVDAVSRVSISFLDIEGFASELYSVGVENDELVKSRYHFQRDVLENEVILNKALADMLKVKENDRVTIANQSLKIKEVLQEQDAFGVMPDVLLMHENTLKKMGKVEGEATYLLIKKSTKADVYELVNQLQNLDTDLRVDIAEENEFQKENLNQLSIFIIVLSVLLLIITSLFTLANFDVLLYKYVNEFAIMRSMGAETKQLFHIVWRQGLIINTIGGAAGWMLAYLSQGWLMDRLGEKFSMSISTMSFPLMGSLAITLFCMFLIQAFLVLPSLRATKVLPIRMMQKSVESGKVNKKRRSGAAIGLALFSLLCIGLGMTTSPYPEMMLILAAILFIIVILLLYPIYVTVFLNKLLPIYQKLFGKQSFVVIKNMMENMRKSSFITWTICTFIIISIFGSTLLKTIEKNNERYLEDQYISDIVLSNRLTESTVNINQLQKEIQTIERVEHVSISSQGSPLTARKNEGMEYYDFSFIHFEEMRKQSLLPKNMEWKEHGIIITEKVAKELQVNKGDSIQFGEYSNRTQSYQYNGTLSVIGIVEKLPGSYHDIYIDWQDMEYVKSHLEFVAESVDQVYISTKNIETTKLGLEALQGTYPQLKIHTLEEAKNQSKELFDQRWFLFKAVMMMIILGVLLGIINSFVNDIHTRRKELAILRVISLNVKQIVQLIILQVCLYVFFGVILGLLSGVIITYIISLVDPGVTFDFAFISMVIGLLLFTILSVMIPYGYHIGRLGVVDELTNTY